MPWTGPIGLLTLGADDRGYGVGRPIPLPAERRLSLLDSSDPLLRVQAEVPLGDHADASSRVASGTKLSVLKSPYRMTRIRVVVLVVLGSLAVSCSDGNRMAKPSASAEAARVRSLDLTSEVPELVLAVCARASNRVTVPVRCPELIPDVPLFSPGTGLHGVISFEPDYYMLTFNDGDPPGPARHWIVGGGLVRAVQKWVLSDFAPRVKRNLWIGVRKDRTRS
jgi:hypothetical protein